MIHIFYKKKLCQIGDDQFALSKQWYLTHSNDSSLKCLSNNVLNYFRNYCSTSAKDYMWTVYEGFDHLIQGKGFRKGYCHPDEDFYIGRKYLAYLSNPFVSGKQGGATIDDQYALSEMLQFIWRSAIRDGKDIWIYIPSVRMRNLLVGWIKENSTTLSSQKENNPL